MDAITLLRRRVGDTPLVKAPTLAKHVGLPNLRLKMEGANPTGTQKDRVARLEVADAIAQGRAGITVASCGNFGVAVAHAAYLHKFPCVVFVPEDFQGERIHIMEQLGAKVERAPGSYEDAVVESRQYALANNWGDANPGQASTLRSLSGYATIADEILRRMKPAAVGVPIGNGTTLAGVHLGFRNAWGRGAIAVVPKVFGGTSRDNNPLPTIVARGQERAHAIDPRSVVETAVNEPLVNWDALDGDACLVAIRDAQGSATGHTDEELVELHEMLLKDNIDAHPASLAAVAALRTALEMGEIDADAPVVAILTSGRPMFAIEPVATPTDDAERDEFIATVKTWLGRFADPTIEMDEAISAAFAGGFVLAARQGDDVQGYAVITPMEWKEFFPAYHLSYIATHPDARGRGIGTTLLEEAIRVTDGALSLHVETDNEGAIQLYEKFGFAKKYYRMLYQGTRTPGFDPADGVGWHPSMEEAAMVASRRERS